MTTDVAKSLAVPVMHVNCTHVPSRTLEMHRVGVFRSFNLNAQLFNLGEQSGEQTPFKEREQASWKTSPSGLRKSVSARTRAELIPAKLLTKLESKPARNRNHGPLIFAVGRQLVASASNTNLANQGTRWSDCAKVRERVLPRPEGGARARCLCPHPGTSETNPDHTRKRPKKSQCRRARETCEGTYKMARTRVNAEPVQFWGSAPAGSGVGGPQVFRDGRPARGTRSSLPSGSYQRSCHATLRSAASRRLSLSCAAAR